MAYNNRRYAPRRNYNRRYRPRRNYTRRNTRGGTVTQYDWKKIAWQAAKGALAYSMTNAELKWYDETTAAAAFSTSTPIEYSLIRGITQGDGASNFDGQSMRIKSAYLTFTNVINASATSTRYRWYVIADYRPATSQAGWSDVFADISLTPRMNLNGNPDRFRILKKGKGVLNSTDNLETLNSCFVKLDNKVRFTSAAVPRNYDLLFFIISDENTNTPTCAINTRLRYYDN